MSLKSILLSALSFVLVAAVAVGGTLAYLTSTDSDVNVMTLGNVEIEQIEQERDENGNLVDFTQAKPLYPAVGEVAWNDNKVNINGHDYNMFGEKLRNSVDKIISVKNTGKNDAYVRTWIAIEDPFTTSMIGINVGGTGYTESSWMTAEIDGVAYSVKCFTYNEVLEPNKESLPSLLQVYLKSAATNEDVALLGDTHEILAFSQAVQADGFTDAVTALNEAFGEPKADNLPWASGVVIPTVVYDAEQLTDALTAGKSVVLANDIDLAENTSITIGNGVNATLDLNGHTVYGENTRTATHNFLIDVKGGTLNISNGTVSMLHTGANMGWNGAATAIDVTAGGVLNMDGVTVKVDGTDMNFAVHLNNWGEVTLNANNCVFDSTYCGVRVFNSGYDMNNVKITNSTLKGNTRAFWVHNYIGDLNATQHPDDAINARLNLDIYNNNNTFTIAGTAKSPIRYGFGTTVYYDAAGNLVP